jgi:sulfur relay (sulfurtransferase) DsrF/TusC family protein
MQRHALFIIESDPRRSGRPAEAIRIAAGVSVWKRIKAVVYLRDAAVLALGEDAGELIGGDNYSQHLALLRESSGPVLVQKDAAMKAQLGPTASPFEEISDERLASLAASSACVLRF